MIRRALLVCSKRYNSLNGGVATFVKGMFSVLKNNGCFVDIAYDVNPEIDYTQGQGMIFYPDSPLKYSEHRSRHVFRDSLCVERIMNFKSAIAKAFEHAVYDLIVVNDEEAVDVVYTMGLKVPVVYYTHNPESIVSLPSSPFAPNYVKWLHDILRRPGLIVGTQSPENCKFIKDRFGDDVNVKFLPMPLAEEDILRAKQDKDADGILFIGTFQERKDPEEFIRVCVETGQHAKVMTSQKGVKKFQQAFEQAGVVNYTIKHSISGQEKIDFIKSAKVGYHPSRLETFGYGVMETSCVIPTVTLDYPWTLIHEGYVTRATKDNVVDVIKGMIESDQEYAGPHASYHDDIFKSWSDMNDLVCNVKPDPEIVAHMKEHGGCSINDLIFTVKGRRMMSFCEYNSIYNKINSPWAKRNEYKEGSFFGDKYTKSDIITLF